MMLTGSEFLKNLQKCLFFGFAIVCFAAVSTLAFAASDVTFVLQLGSFDSKEQAIKKWEELRAKNPDALSNLDLHISAVSMSGDSKVKYRTQAGPVDSHEHAAALCNKLSASGAQCYVVETAIFNSDVSPEIGSSASGFAEAPEEPKHIAAAAEPEKVTARSSSSSNATITGLSSQDIIVPERAPRFLDADDVHTEVVVAAAPAIAPAPAAEIAPAPAPVEERVAEKPAKKAESEVTEAPVKHRAKHHYEQESSSPAAQRNSNPFAQKPKVADDEEEEEAPRPKPKKHVAKAEAPPAPEENPAPAEPKKPGFFSRLFGSSKSSDEPKPTPASVKPVTATTEEGSVSVAEAIRVPLSGDDSGSAKPAYRIPQENAHFNSPTAVSGDTYWAQISYFPDEASAHSFYEEFRNNYPDVSDGLRMRITRPYAASSNKGGRVTLRMGTFADTSTIDLVCSLAAGRNLNCISVKAGPASASTDLAEKKPPMERPVEAMSQIPDFANTAVAEPMVYWVQLGTFDTSDDAWDTWKAVKKVDKKIIGKTNAAVTQPDASTADKPMFRLRAGPFTSRGEADALCDKLTNRGENCLVVGEQRRSEF